MRDGLKILVTPPTSCAILYLSTSNKTRPASTGFGPICAPRWVTFQGAWE